MATLVTLVWLKADLAVLRVATVVLATRIVALDVKMHLGHAQHHLRQVATAELSHPRHHLPLVVPTAFQASELSPMLPTTRS